MRRRDKRLALAMLWLTAAAGVAGVAIAQGERLPVVVTPGSKQTYRVALQRFSHAAQTGPRPAKVNAFLGGRLDETAMREAVDASLYRNRAGS